MTIRLTLISFLMAAILAISCASAQTLIAGKVYNSDYSSVIGGASVTVHCGVSDLATISLNDGTYAVRFDKSNCTLGNGVSVTSSKDRLRGSKSGVVAGCLSGNCGDEYSTVINTAMKDTGSGNSGGSSSGGGHARVYICGNGKCDSGETATTCARDCKKTANSTNTTCTTTTCPVDNQTETIALTSTEPVSFGITGASVMWENLLSIPFFVGLLAFLIVLLIGHKVIKNKNRKKKRIF